jgi:hypothetical protein
MLRKGIGPADKTGQEALLSAQLLKRIGEFLHGQQWQAPLARDISVGERSMRRWAAGTDEVPNGVWRDIALRLESLQGDLEYLIGEVRRMSGLVEVYSFKVWDSRAGEMVRPRAKSTAARIARIKGEIILGTAEWVVPSSVDAEGRVRHLDLSIQAYLHVDGATFPKNSLFNAISDVVENPARATALIDCNGRSYQGFEIDEIARSAEFGEHRAKLAAEGKVRD